MAMTGFTSGGTSTRTTLSRDYGMTPPGTAGEDEEDEEDRVSVTVGSDSDSSGSSSSSSSSDTYTGDLSSQSIDQIAHSAGDRDIEVEGDTASGSPVGGGGSLSAASSITGLARDTLSDMNNIDEGAHHDASQVAVDNREYDAAEPGGFAYDDDYGSAMESFMVEWGQENEDAIKTYYGDDGVPNSQDDHTHGDDRDHTQDLADAFDAQTESIMEMQAAQAEQTRGMLAQLAQMFGGGAPGGAGQQTPSPSGSNGGSGLGGLVNSKTVAYAGGGIAVGGLAYLAYTLLL